MTVQPAVPAQECGRFASNRGGVRLREALGLRWAFSGHTRATRATRDYAGNAAQVFLYRRAGAPAVLS